MGNLMFTLETAKNTLLNTQVAIQTSSHNIANADSPNYARQKAVAQTSGAYRTRPGWIGMGASIEQVVQQREQFVDRRLLESISSESHYGALSSQLRTLGTYMLDDGASGVSSALGNFWNAWETLQKNPVGLAERENVNHAAQRMADALNTDSTHLQRLMAGLDSEIEMLAGRTGADESLVEGLFSNLAVLNRQIRLAETPRHHANDLRDQRFGALHELSQYLPIEYVEEKNGSVTVRLKTDGASLPLVEGEKGAQIKFEDQKLYILPPHLDPASAVEGDWVEVSLQGSVGGRLSGLLAARGEMEKIEGKLQGFAETFAESVNGVLADPTKEMFHREGGTGPWRVSTDFWLNYDPQTNPSAIKDLSGLASAMTALGDTRHGGLGNATFSDYLADLQRQLGGVQRDADAKGEFYQTLRGELQKQQQSVSGVNLDEEMVDLLRNQQVYQAAAKIIQRTGEMLQRVIDMV